MLLGLHIVVAAQPQDVVSLDYISTIIITMVLILVSILNL